MIKKIIFIITILIIFLSINAFTVEKEQVELSNYEDTVLYLINVERAENGLGALTANQALNDIAKSRSTDMLNRNYYSHYTPEGKIILDILKENNIDYKNAGENLASWILPEKCFPKIIINTWMDSPLHRANIIRGAYSQMGISVIDNGDRKILTVIFTN